MADADTTRPINTTVKTPASDEVIQELRKIRELLTPPVAPTPKGMKNEFLAFLSQYKVMGLAVAFILGIYLGLVVQKLVSDLIMPVVTIAMPGTSWQTLAFGPFLIGDFAGTVLTFLIVALVIFLIVKLTVKWGVS
ncbi:MAG: MscL family protein [Nitrososphaerales archaeon]